MGKGVGGRPIPVGAVVLLVPASTAARMRTDAKTVCFILRMGGVEMVGPKKKKEALSELMLQIYVLAIIMNEPLQ